MLARHVFLGLAYDKLNKNDEAEKAYRAATKLKDSDKTAWQGLVNLYEKQGSHKLDAYREATVKLAQIYADAYAASLPRFGHPSPHRLNIADRYYRF